MRIDAIEVFHVAMPLIYPWRTAYGEDTAIDSVVVRMEGGDREAWSETTPFCGTPIQSGVGARCISLRL